MAKLNIIRRTTAVASPVSQPMPKAAEESNILQMHTSDDVLVTTPKPFTLTDNDHAPHKYPAGSYMMPRDHAMHWYAKANGVQIAEVRQPA